MTKEKQLEFDFPRANQLWILKHCELKSCLVQSKNGKFTGIKAGKLKAVIRTIDDYANGGVGWPSVRTIAAGANVSETTVKLALAALRSPEVSVLHVKLQMCPVAGKVLNHYRIVWSELAMFVPGKAAKPRPDGPIVVPFSTVASENNLDLQMVESRDADDRPIVECRPPTDSRFQGTDSRFQPDRWSNLDPPIVECRLQSDQEVLREKVQKEHSLTEQPVVVSASEDLLSVDCDELEPCNQPVAVSVLDHPPAVDYERQLTALGMSSDGARGAVATALAQGLTHARFSELVDLYREASASDPDITVGYLHRWLTGQSNPPKAPGPAPKPPQTTCGGRGDGLTREQVRRENLRVRIIREARSEKASEDEIRRRCELQGVDY